MGRKLAAALCVTLLILTTAAHQQPASYLQELEQYPSAAHKLAALLESEEPVNQEDLNRLLQSLRRLCPSGAAAATHQLSTSDLVTRYSRQGVLDQTAVEAACSAIMSCQLDNTCTLTGDPSPSSSNSQAVTPWLRAATAAGLCAEALLGVLIPLWLRSVEGYSWWLSLLNCFSGGVFLAAGLVHLLPHCLESQAALGDIIGDYPLALVLITLGYLLVLFVERVLFDVHGAAHSHGPHTGYVNPVAVARLAACSLAGVPCNAPNCVEPAEEGAHTHDHDHDHDHHQHAPSEEHSHSDHDHHTHTTAAAAGNGAEHHHDHQTGPRTRKQQQQEGSEAMRQPLLASHQDHHQHSHERRHSHGGGGSWQGAVDGGCHHHHHPPPPPGLHQGLVLLLAMSIHTFLECMALGLMSSVREFYMLLVAIASHKLISGLALSSRFIKDGATTRQVLVCCLPFVAVAPAAILTGGFVRDVNPVLHLALSCFATGTFLYVGASEIVEEEFEGDMRSGREDISPVTARYLKFLVLLLGVGAISGLSLLPDAHDHGPTGAAAAGGHHHHHHHHHH